MYKKTTTTVEEFFEGSALPQIGTMSAGPVINPKALKPVIRLDVPLIIRLFEHVKEGPKTETELHEMTNRMVTLCEYGDVLELSDFEVITKPSEPPQVKPPEPTPIA